MYFAIAYEIWPYLLGRQPLSVRPIRLQLWLWFVGMLVTTFPWHVLGLLSADLAIAEMVERFKKERAAEGGA